MLALATHDTKRGADARARLAALSGLAEAWREQLPIWSRILRGPSSAPNEPLRPDRNDEYLLYQLLLGSWPCELLPIAPGDAESQHSAAAAALRAYAQRVRKVMSKSMREARVHTNWAFPSSEYEEAMMALIDAALTGARAAAFLGAFLPFVRRLAEFGMYNSLVQSVLALTSPGVPDLYNGMELWDFSMVDPDNRAPVDFALRERLLAQCQSGLREDRAGSLRHWLESWPDGRIKLAVTQTLLQARAERAELFAAGDYQPLAVTGTAAEEVCAFARSHAGQSLICIVARFPHRRAQQGLDSDVRIALPASLSSVQWRELLTGRELVATADGLAAAGLLEPLPAAVLVSSASGG
jgi:(1->4)-alpha-D-glucan 1-alpha-D-glucosylmutase